MTNDETWRAANRASRRMFELSGWAVIVTALVSLGFAGDRGLPAAPLAAGAMISGVLGLIGRRQGVKAAEEVLARDDNPGPATGSG